MPPAAAITMPSAQVSPVLPARGTPGPASTSDRDFGALFREKSGAVQIPVPTTAAWKNSGASTAAPALAPEPRERVSTAGSPGEADAASANSSPGLPPSQSQDAKASHFTANITPPPRGAIAVLFTAAISEPEAGPAIGSQPASRKFSLPPQAELAHKAKPLAQAAAKADAANIPTPVVVSFSAAPNLPLVPAAASPMLLAVPPISGPPNGSQATNAAARQRNPPAGLNRDSQILSAQQSATQNSGDQFQPTAKDQAEPNASDPASSSATQRSGLDSVEKAASPSEGATHDALPAHSSIAQSAQPPAPSLENLAVAPAQARSNEPVPSAPSHIASSVALAPATAPGPAPNPGSNLPNLYDKIDQGSAPTLLQAGAQHVAVGVRDPDLGWVEIKTQNLAGHVDAALVTASGQTHSTLAAQLPAISEFLQQRDVRLGTLAVHHQPPGTNAGSGQNGSGSGPDTRNPSQSGSGHRQQNGEAANFSRSRTLAAASPGLDGAAFRPISYISVRA